jgi:predicted alpha/beta-fold hydrolase
MSRMSPIPEFSPHPLFPGGHAQTIAGRFVPGLKRVVASTMRSVTLADADSLLIEESIPPSWTRGKPMAVLVHGLAGCARAPYLMRLAGRLDELGVRVVRMNLRGAGPSLGRTRGLYHAGRTGDLRAVVNDRRADAPESPVALIGFSLGANLVLKLAGEAAEDTVPGLDCVIGASPPADLAACCRYLQRPGGRLYDRNLCQELRRSVEKLHKLQPELGETGLEGVRSVFAFDDRYTAPRNGFASAEDYYARSSCRAFVSRIRIPGLVIHAWDDPFIPAHAVADAPWPPNLERKFTMRGGHLGFVSRHAWAGDRRWLECRIAAWLADRWGLEFPPGEESSHGDVDAPHAPALVTEPRAFG